MISFKNTKYRCRNILWLAGRVWTKPFCGWYCGCCNCCGSGLPLRTRGATPNGGGIAGAICEDAALLGRTAFGPGDCPTGASLLTPFVCTGGDAAVASDGIGVETEADREPPKGLRA